MVYVGANDGALHAFVLSDQDDSGTTIYGGTELWRFYPYSLHDKLAKGDPGDPTYDNSFDRCGDSYCHKYYVDGNPIATDIFDPTEGASGAWKTILVTGLREGGEAYFTLDVTYGREFDHTDTDKRTKFLWEFSGVTDPELGLAWSEPSINRVDYPFTSGTAWGVFFGSGHKEDLSAQANKEAYLFGLEAHDGSSLWPKVQMASGVTNNALASPLVADFEGDNVADVIYIGDLYGSMYRVTPIGKGETPVVSKLYNSGNVDHATSIRAKATYAFGEDDSVIWVYFGTGKYESQDDKISTDQQYFFGLKEDIDDQPTYTLASSDLVILDLPYESGTTNYRTLETGSANGDKKSWAIQLFQPLSGEFGGSERVITEPLVTSGVVFFTTFIPDDDVCEGNGEAWLFALEYDTGLPPDLSVFDTNEDGVIDDKDVPMAGIRIGEGQPSKPILFKDTVFVNTTDDPEPRPVPINPEINRARLKSWRVKN
jgi:Tfp pilus tip-associated adhesin PilY1